MRDRVSLVYGLARKPVSVVGDVNLTLDLGGCQTVTHTFDVLSETRTTIILGRDHLRRSHRLNLIGVRIRFGSEIFGKNHKPRLREENHSCERKSHVWR